jgi:hypothetical protein
MVVLFLFVIAAVLVPAVLAIGLFALARADRRQSPPARARHLPRRSHTERIRSGRRPGSAGRPRFRGL